MTFAVLCCVWPLGRAIGSAFGARDPAQRAANAVAAAVPLVAGVVVWLGLRWRRARRTRRYLAERQRWEEAAR